MIKGIEHVGIASLNSDALAEWYVKNLSFEVKSNNGRGGYFLLDPNGTMIEIYPADKNGEKEFDNKTTGLRHIAFLVEDFDFEYNRLLRAGIEFLDKPSITEKISNVFFKDPDGNLLHIIERR